jgi:polyisoprenyl-teichoic acid--peptidoglycan teichoic acid transferase
MAVSQAASSRSPLGAASASAAVPGWGQVLAGHRRLGLALIGVSTFVALTVAAVLWEVGPTHVLSWALKPDTIIVLVALNFVVAAVRVWSTTHAWISAGGRLGSIVLLLIVLLVAAPHAALGYLGVEARSTLLTVFSSDPVPSISASETTSTATTLITTTTSETLVVAPVPVAASPPNIPASTTTTLPLGTARYTVLLLGGDAGPGRAGLRTDTMIVASIDTLTGDAALFGLPRNMGGFTFSDGSPFPGLGQGLLNEVYQWGWKHPDRFAGVDPGAIAVKDVASNLLGIPIDHFVLVDMIGFADVIDALDGVTVDVGRPIQAPRYDRVTGGHEMVTLDVGEQHLNGDLALAYARSRTGSSDYERMGRQRCLLGALAEQADPLKIFARLPEILHVVKRDVTTDIPLSMIPYMIDLAPLLDRDRLVVVGFDRGYRSGYTPNGLGMPDIAKIRGAVQAALDGDWESAGLGTAASSCG